ncbi:MAG: hypothetical protein C0613_10710 [Desulfobulbaceae bacterium]|nr:MAG: hypothetical protein C0613_10710 [Desulfobulbaceae bacterium]
MTPLVPVMLFGWVPFTILLFMRLPAHRAVLVAVIGGWLFLPTVGYNWQGIPPYNKYVAISLGLMLGGWLSGQRFKADFKWKLCDLPMLLWCLSPIPTALTNHLGLYDGVSGLYDQVMTWGIPYLAGRIYFKEQETIRDLCQGIVAGGMVYALLCLYEIRMSPRLNVNFYGFFPHEWRQHYRYGGWRPIVFMQHGLMVAVWMAATATTAFWLWRSRLVTKVKGIAMGPAAILLMVTALLCKSASGWVVLLLGCTGYSAYRRSAKNLFFIMLLLLIPAYIGVRSIGLVPMDEVVGLVAEVFDEERTGSLAVRLLQEDLFAARALEQPVFGWGGYSRGWPVDPDTGKKTIKMVDSLWIIVFSSKGFFGITTLVAGMLIGPWQVLRSTGRQYGRVREEGLTLQVVLLSFIVILFMIDTLVNAMVNPIYIMISGALVSWGLTARQQGENDSASLPARSSQARKSGILVTSKTPFSFEGKRQERTCVHNPFSLEGEGRDEGAKSVSP